MGLSLQCIRKLALDKTDGKRTHIKPACAHDCKSQDFKMKLLIACIIFSLFSKAHPLQCYKCIPTGTAPCTRSEQTCSSGETQCISGSSVTTVLTHQALNVSYQTCGSPSGCEENVSLNFGISRTTVDSQCCDKDLCNTEFPQVSKNDTVNGLECCQDEGCTKKIQCVGNEKVCLKMQYSTGGIHSETRGCATSNVCTVQSYQVPGVVQGTVSCCRKSLCNSAKHISVNILVLLLPLLLYKMI